MNTKLADARADIYSLGCTLYYFLAGKPMYGGTTVMEKIMAHREKPIPSLRDVQATVPDQLDAVFKKMVAKRIEDRYQSIAELLPELDHCGDVQAGQVIRQTPEPTSETILDSEPTLTMHGNKRVSGNRKAALIGAALLGIVMLASAVVSIMTRDGTQLRNKAPVTSTILPIANKPVRTPLAFEKPEFEKWEESVSAKPAHEQLNAVVSKLRELNPNFDGKVTSADGKGTPKIEDGVVTEFGLVTDNVIDISPVRALKSLNKLLADGTYPVKSTFFDLSPLKDMRLTTLHCGYSQVSDLSPIKGMLLTKLFCDHSRVSTLSPLQGMQLTVLQCNGCTELSDLSPLKKMPLARLECYATKVATLAPLNGLPLVYLDFGATLVTDLAPLKGMPLVEIRLWSTRVTDLSPLKEMPLSAIECHNTPVSDLSPLKEMPLVFVNCGNTKVSDLSPLDGMRLERVLLTPRDITEGMDAIRRMKSLKIIGLDQDQQFSSNDFWKKYDAGEFGKPTKPQSAAAASK